MQANIGYASLETPEWYCSLRKGQHGNTTLQTQQSLEYLPTIDECRTRNVISFANLGSDKLHLQNPFYNVLTRFKQIM